MTRRLWCTWTGRRSGSPDLIGTEAGVILDELGITLGLSLCDAPFASVVREAERQRWTRDPFDRIIVAQAALSRATLITKDATIHAHYEAAVW